MKVGIFGGTFNPPHNSHTQLVVQAKKQLQLDEVLVVPCGIPPHKKCDVDSATRFRLAQLAFADIAKVCDCEIKKDTKSYTVETLRLIREEYPDAQLFLILGGDSFSQFDKWYKPQEIASLATLAVAARTHKVFERTKKRIQKVTQCKTVFLDVNPSSISSTQIRLAYQFGLDNSGSVPKSVDDFVLQHNLYSDYRPLVEKLRTYLPEKRFMHTFYVVKRGLELADDDEKDKVFLACLLHDCAKYIQPQRYADYGFVCPQDMPEPVVHSFLGANVAQRDFAIDDADILQAIAYHTTGCPNMTRLQKIVYVADKTEETRPYPLAHLCKGSLDRQFKACLLDAAYHNMAAHKDESLYSLSKQTLDFYFPDGLPPQMPNTRP